MRSAVLLPVLLAVKFWFAALWPVYTVCQRQCCDSFLIENNRVAPEKGLQPIISSSIVFNENRIASFIACNGADARCEQAPTTIRQIALIKLIKPIPPIDILS